METVVSGVRSTGNLHIGNYFGAVKNFVKMQEDNNCFFFVADYHSLTTHPKPDNFHQNVKTILAEYLACGLDPEKAVMYVQSDVPEIPELYLLFNMIAYKGELERSTTYKDKVAKQQDNINAGLLTYPVLMAVDIIIHHADKVPVGKDQEQHLEMTRTFTNRFNHMYGTEYFKEPQAFSFTENLIKVPGLDGSGKMGKSEGAGNAIYLAEDADSIRKKVMRAKTDSGPTEPNSEKPQEIQNLFTLMDIVSDQQVIAKFEADYNNCEIRYGELKQQLAEDMVNFTAPIKERIEEISADEAYISKVVKEGADKARASASKTIKEVREIIGIKSF